MSDFQEGGSRRSSTKSCRGSSTSSPHTALLQAADTRGSYLAVPGQSVRIITRVHKLTELTPFD